MSEQERVSHCKLSLQQTPVMVWKNLLVLRKAKVKTALRALLPFFFIYITYLLRGLVKVEDLPDEIMPFAYPFADPASLFCYNMNVSSVFEPSLGLEGIVALAPNTPQVRDMAAYLSNMTNCTLGRIEVFESEAAITDYYTAYEYPLPMAWSAEQFVGTETLLDPIVQSIIFSEYSPDWTYTFRPPPNNWMPMHEYTDIFEDSVVHDYYYYYSSSISHLQIMLNEYIINQETNGSFNKTVQLSHTIFPFAAHIADQFYIIAPFLAWFAFFLYFFPIASMIRSLVVDKEQKIKEGMTIMGLSKISFWASWFIVFMLLNLVGIVFMLLVDAFPNSDTIELFHLYLVSSMMLTSFSMFVSTLFSTARTATLISALMMVATFSPYVVSTESISVKTWFSLAPFTAFCYTLETLGLLESLASGVNSFTYDAVINNYSFATGITMMWIDFFLYFFLALYMDEVMPREWGTPQPVYFLCQKSYWCGVKPGEGEDVGKPVTFDPKYHEKVLESSTIGVQLRHVGKEFTSIDGKSVVAVKDLSLDIYENEIFALLGHNGAGKTTLMNMLTGLMPITSGKATILGLDCSHDMHQIRQSMGLCPQHDILLPELTVCEHMSLYSALRGVPKGEERDNTINELIKSIQLDDQCGMSVSSLSGGQKRKLSCIISLLGRSKVVMLDEPTSGMDPFARRACWATLKKYRQGRTIVFSTHFMDEADLLGDRIAIMAKGSIICCGSSLFLKSLYGVGYTFVCTKGQEEDHEGHTKVVEDGKMKSIKALVKEHVPSSNLLSDVGTEVSFKLPLSASASFVPMLEELDNNKSDYGISNYGLSVTTLEEVFLKVGHEAKADMVAVTTNDDTEKKDNEKESIEMSKVGKPSKAQDSQMAAYNDRTKDLGAIYSIKTEPAVGFALFSRHFGALIHKRWNFSKRDSRALVFQFVIPAIILILSLTLLQISANTKSPYNPFSSVNYNQPAYMPVGYDDVDTYNTMFSLMDGITEETLEDSGMHSIYDLNEWILTHRTDHEQSRYGALYCSPLDNDTISATIIHNTTAYHSLPVYTNVFYDFLIKYAASDPTVSITSGVYELPNGYGYKFGIQVANNFFVVIFISIAFCFIPASYAVFVVREREIGAKHIQFISGVNSFSYWASIYAWDLLQFIFSFAACLIILLIDDNPVFVHDSLGMLILTFIMYGISICPFTYMLSFFFKSHSSAQTFFLIAYFATGTLLLIVSFVLIQFNSTRKINESLVFVYRLFPSYCLGDGLLHMMLIDLDNRGLWHMDVSGWNLIYMAIETVVYSIIVLVLEMYSHDPAILQKLDRTVDVNAVESWDDDDVDVIETRKRVNDKIAAGDKSSVLVNGIRKRYPNDGSSFLCSSSGTLAVQSVSFDVEEGECFGYLGTNGAGKTTTLAALTGDIHPTSGDALIRGYSIIKDFAMTRQMIGYCPQFDALLPLLTARENLEFFALIKGVPRDKIAGMAQAMIENLSLQEYADRPCGTYSGGNKRKLSVAMALMGNPPVVFLDEPSTGMDPMARRFMWNFISETMKGRCVILTSHSMEEVEALCQKVGIMVNGRLKCIGSTQHLKSRHGTGFQLDVTKELVPVSLPEVTVDIEKKSNEEVDPILNRFPGTVIIEQHGSNAKYSIPNDNGLTFSSIFSTIEEKKKEWGIVEYSVSQMSLEQVFLKFAQTAAQHNIMHDEEF